MALSRIADYIKRPCSHMWLFTAVDAVNGIIDFIRRPRKCR